MAKYTISKRFPYQVSLSEKVISVMRMFGLTVDQLCEKAVKHQCSLKINDGDVVFITGPSGSGKSVLLQELERLFPLSEKLNLAEIETNGGKCVVDYVEGGFLEALRFLNTAGLNDVYCILNQPRYLSDGQKYRYRLAMALATKKRYVFADEFCSELDRITASVIAYNIRRYAKRYGITFVLASSQDDMLPDLEPDVLVINELSGKTQVIYKQYKSDN